MELIKWYIKARHLKWLVAAVLVSFSMVYTSCQSGGSVASDDCPILLPDGTCANSLDEALDLTEDGNYAELVMKAGDYEFSRTIRRGRIFRAADAKDIEIPSINETDCLVGWRSSLLTLTPTVTIRAKDAESGIVVDMLDEEHRLALVGVDVKGSFGSPALTVRRGRVILANSKLSSPLVATGSSTRIKIGGAVIIGEPGLTLSGTTQYPSNNYGAYDVMGACNEALLVVDGGASLYASGLELLNHSPLGLCVNAARAHLCGGSIHDIESDSENRLGRGAHVTNGGNLILQGVEIQNVREAGVMAKEAGTELSLTDGTKISNIESFGEIFTVPLGVIMQEGASLTTEDVSITDVDGPGIWLSGGSSAAVQSTDIASTKAAGVAVFDATLSLSGGTIQGTTISTNLGAGYGLYIDSTALGPAAVTADTVTISGNECYGVVVFGDGNSISIQNSTISDHPINSSCSAGLHSGYGILASNVCSGLTLSNTTFSGNESSHILLDASNVTLGPITFATSGGRYGDFVQQRCYESCVTPIGNADLAAAGLTDPPFDIEICSQYDCSTTSDDLTLYLELEEVAH